MASTRRNSALRWGISDADYKLSQLNNGLAAICALQLKNPALYRFLILVFGKSFEATRGNLALAGT
jgi:hypothetical protein